MTAHIGADRLELLGDPRPELLAEVARVKPEQGGRVGAPRSPARSKRWERYYEASSRASSHPNAAKTDSPAPSALGRSPRPASRTRARRAGRAAHAATPALVADAADLVETVIDAGDPQKAKALLRLLIDDLRVNGRAELLPTYRLVTPELLRNVEKWAEPDIAQTMSSRPRPWLSTSDS
jgi:hypothetical protein